MTAKAAKVETEKRVFVSPEQLNSEFLVVAGELVTAGANAFSGGLPIAMRRDGDVFAKFTNGILATDDPDIIAWCEANPDICRDAADPQTEAWAMLKDMQLETSSKESTLPRNANIDAMLRGESPTGGPESLVTRARKLTAK